MRNGAWPGKKFLRVQSGFGDAVGVSYHIFVPFYAVALLQVKRLSANLWSKRVFLDSDKRNIRGVGSGIRSLNQAEPFAVFDRIFKLTFTGYLVSYPYYLSEFLNILEFLFKNK